MPYYELRCADCQTEFKVKAAIQERSEKSIRCPNCASLELETIYRKVNILRHKDSECEACALSDSAGSCCGGSCRYS